MNKSYNEENLGQTIWHFLPGIVKFLSVLGVGLVIFNLININLASSIKDDLEETTKTSHPLIRTYNPVLGKADAELKLVYFIDYQCPVCASNNENMSTLKTEYKDRIQFVYKHYPIVTAHVYAESAAKSIQAAARQNKAFELGDILLSRQTDGFSPSNFSVWAKELNIDIDKFEQDRGSRQISREVEIDQLDFDRTEFPTSTLSGQKKVSGEKGGTPTTVLVKNDKIVDWWSGRADISEVKSKLDEYLK
jgi:Thioredoxin